MDEYRKQMEKGDIKEAYKGLMAYIMGLRSYFDKKYPEYSVPGSIYYGYMDMTYFPVFPEALKLRKLKVAIVFIHDTCRFEVWLAGYNKQVQAKYWKLFKESDWKKYHIPPTTKGVDSILEHVVVENPDFSDLDMLTKQIDAGALTFIKDVEDFLSKH
jgi:malate synthase